MPSARVTLAPSSVDQTNSNTPEKLLRSGFGLALFLSGTAALVFQVLWIRQLSLVVGVEIYSITIAVSAFFA